MTALVPLATERAIARLLHRNDLDLPQIGRTLDQLVAADDFADLYFELGEAEGWQLEDRKVMAGSYSTFQGVGARAVYEGETAFAHSGEISRGALDRAVGAVRGMRRQGVDADRTGGISLDIAGSQPQLYGLDNPIEAMDAAVKLDLLRRLDARCRTRDSRIVHVSGSLNASQGIVLVADSDGRIAADIRPQVRLSLSLIAEQEGRRANGSASIGGRFDIEAIDDAKVEALIDKVVTMALVNLDARPAPVGVMPVVLGPGFPGVLLHEAVGHGLEGDAHRKRSSVFTDRMSDRIAAPGVTVIDDGTIAGRTGSLHIDDEGQPTEATTLIEDGRLTGLMQDRLNARLMNQRQTGNGRRQSYAHLPMPRMTNTYLAAGNHDPAEIISSVKQGLYAVNFGGGQVDITSGQFNFSTTEAYLIEDGRITAPVEGATLIGMGDEALKHIRMIGNDLSIEDGLCGKAGQSVGVGVGQPTVRIDEMVVGGAA